MKRQDILRQITLLQDKTRILQESIIADQIVSNNKKSIFLTNTGGILDRLLQMQNYYEDRKLREEAYIGKKSN